MFGGCEPAVQKHEAPSTLAVWPTSYLDQNFFQVRPIALGKHVTRICSERWSIGAFEAKREYLEDAIVAAQFPGKHKQLLLCPQMDLKDVYVRDNMRKGNGWRGVGTDGDAVTVGVDGSSICRTCRVCQVKFELAMC